MMQFVLITILKMVRPSGIDAAKWLTEHCMRLNEALPKWNIQSANPIGKKDLRHC
jgi:hypothetical protein